MQKRLRDNELRILRGELEVDEGHLDNDSDVSASSSEASLMQRPRQPAAAFVTVKEQASTQATHKGEFRALENTTCWQHCIIIWAKIQQLDQPAADFVLDRGQFSTRAARQVQQSSILNCLYQCTNFGRKLGALAVATCFRLCACLSNAYSHG